MGPVGGRRTPGCRRHPGRPTDTGPQHRARTRRAGGTAPLAAFHDRPAGPTLTRISGPGRLRRPDRGPMATPSDSTGCRYEIDQVWFEPPLPGHWSTDAPPVVDWPLTSAVLPLFRLTRR